MYTRCGWCEVALVQGGGGGGGEREYIFYMESGRHTWEIHLLKRKVPQGGQELHESAPPYEGEKSFRCQHINGPRALGASLSRRIHFSCRVSAAGEQDRGCDALSTTSATTQSCTITHHIPAARRITRAPRHHKPDPRHQQQRTHNTSWKRYAACLYVKTHLIKILVSNLHHNTTTEDVLRLFNFCGPVDKIEITKYVISLSMLPLLSSQIRM